MRKEVVVHCIIVFLLTSSLHAQCPSKDSVQKNITDIFSSLKLKPAEKLAKFLEYENLFGKCFSTKDSDYILLLRKIGFVHSDMADFFGAADYFRRANSIIIDDLKSPSVRLKDLVSGYYFLSTFYDSLNNIAEKINAADKCIEMAIKLNDPTNESCILALYTKVEYYFDIGDYYSCIKTAELCENSASEYLKTAKNPFFAGRIKLRYKSCFGWHVNALLQSGNFTDAGVLLTNKVEEYKKEKLKSYLGLVYAQLADLSNRKRDYASALSYYNLAFAAYKDESDDFNCKQILNNIGQLIYFSHLKNDDKALNYYRQALRYKNDKNFNHRSDSLETLNVFGNIANVFVRKSLYDSAFKYFQVAFNQLKPGFTEDDILKSTTGEFLKYKKIPYISSLVIDKGDAYLEKYKVTGDAAAAKNALYIYKIADKLLNRIKTGQSDLESKLFWRKDSRRLYVNAVELCYLQQNTRDAFYFFERSRAVLLDDQLAEQHWLGSTDISKRTQVSKNILALQNEALRVATDSKRYGEIQQELFVNKQEQHRLEELIRVNSPLYYQGLDSNYITLGEVKTRLLKDHKALLEFFTGDSAVYVLLVTTSDIHFTKISKEGFEKAVTLYISYFQSRDLINEDEDGFRRASGQLYNMIFEHVALPKGRIIISPDGSSYFPFESLITGKSAAGPVYFLTDYIVSYTYSARYLLNNFSSNKMPLSGNFLGVAPVNYRSDFHLTSLSGSDRSLERIGSHMNGVHNLVANNASKSNFLHEFPGYKIIQLYTHSSGSSDRNEPVIYFADSSLYLSELLPENIPATQLIVLSACETGNGRFYQGEGVFSFNRGFAAMGVPSSISNLWAVDNFSTYQLIEDVHKYLSEGLPVDVALQKAKLEFLQSATGEKKLPYFWAAAILVGKSDPIAYKKYYPWKLIFLIAGIALIFAGGALIFIKRRTR